LVGNKRNFVRIQFPVQLACARTIHRAQGLTLEKVAFDPKGVTRHGLVYTALSRVKTIECLYLVNKLEQKNFTVSSKVLVESTRLIKDASLQFQYGLKSIPCNQHLIICSLNTRSMVLHIEDIAHDTELLESHILCLQETHLHSPPMHTIFANQYTCIATYSVHGLVIAVKKGIPILQTATYNEKFVEAIVLDLKLHNNTMKIINIYIKPNTVFDKVNCALNCILSENNNTKMPIVLAGDFNIDMLKETMTKKLIQSYMQTKKLKLKTSHITTSYDSMIDHFWTNLDLDTISFTISDAYWSDHFSCFLSIPFDSI
jgi:exonuclease III